MGAGSDFVKRISDEVFIGGNVALIDELFADDFVSHDPAPGLSADRAGVRALAEIATGAFSDRSLEFDEFLETTDGRVVESWAMVAVHSGEAFGVPPSGRRVRVRGVEIWRCDGGKDGGKVVEHWGAVDMGDLMAKAAGA